VRWIGAVPAPWLCLRMHTSRGRNPDGDGGFAELGVLRCRRSPA
jgi:hypothetical protein